MGRQDDDVAGDVGSEQPVEAEKADDVRRSGNEAQNKGKGPDGRSAAADALPDHLLRVDDLIEALLVDVADLSAASFRVTPSSFAEWAIADTLS